MTGTTFSHNHREYIVDSFTPMNNECAPNVLGIAAAKLNTPKARKATKVFMVKKTRSGNIWFDYVSGVRI